MKEIENQVKQLIEEIEKFADNFEKIKIEFGASYKRNIDGDLEFSLEKIEAIQSGYSMEKEISEVFPEMFEDEDIESKYENKNEMVMGSIPVCLKDSNDYWYSYTTQTTDLLFKIFESLKKQAEYLIGMLEKTDQEKHKQKLDAIDIERIQAKKYITVKEFTEIYGKSDKWQGRRRGRLRDPLPYIQEKSGCSVMYRVSDIEQWIENNAESF